MNIHPKFTPELDPGFIAPILWNRAYEAKAAEAPGAHDVTIAYFAQFYTVRNLLSWAASPRVKAATSSSARRRKCLRPSSRNLPSSSACRMKRPSATAMPWLQPPCPSVVEGAVC